MRSPCTLWVTLSLLLCLLPRPTDARPEQVTAAPSVEVGLQVHAILGPGQSRALAPFGEMRTGDRFTLTVTAKSAVHVYLANVSPSGDIAPLDPAEAQVAPDKEVVLPGPERFFVLDDRVGLDNLLLVASERPLTEAERARHLRLATQTAPPPPPPQPPPNPPPQPPPGHLDSRDRPGLVPAKRVVVARAAHGHVALLIFPIRHQPRQP